ncbi:hypothetical protein SBOR_7007 [Sclerotinia borealis F-4128]|uniref:Uncharacterized protein n=1 Tax=Sclerotinia borealis (strain F-4128) TaxID=1432307 RepID=W9CDE4_SCLBF|nr:hypothetical protein SBOR_7007 [Sclerotinia borealis F-4128]
MADTQLERSPKLTTEKNHAEQRNTDGTLLYDWDGDDDLRNPSILFGLPAGAYGAGNDEMSALFNVSNSASPALVTNLGFQFQWASSLLGFVALVLSLAPVLLLLKGKEIRKRSPSMKEATFAKYTARTTEHGI